MAEAFARRSRRPSAIPRALNGSTIPHEILGVTGPARWIKPAPRPACRLGTVRAVSSAPGESTTPDQELAPNNPPTGRAEQALADLVSVERVARERGIDVDQVGYRARQQES